MFLEMKVSCIVADPFTDMPVVILNEEEGERSLPLWVGFEEASAIAMEIKKNSETKTSHSRSSEKHNHCHRLRNR